MAKENDIVLIHFEDKPLMFARVERIEADHKPGWYHVGLLLLQVPPQLVTWILRDAYIDGGEFTMNGQRIRLELVPHPIDEAGRQAPQERRDAGDRPAGPGPGGKVISLADLKKER